MLVNLRKKREEETNSQLKKLCIKEENGKDVIDEQRNQKAINVLQLDQCAAAMVEVPDILIGNCNTLVGEDVSNGKVAVVEPVNKKSFLDQCPDSLVQDSDKSAKKSRRSTEKRPFHSFRYDGKEHDKAKDNIRQRCKLEGCPYKSYIMCTSCNVHLCCSKKRDCFANFHKIPQMNVNQCVCYTTP